MPLERRAWEARRGVRAAAEAAIGGSISRSGRDLLPGSLLHCRPITSADLHSLLDLAPDPTVVVDRELRVVAGFARRR